MLGILYQEGFLSLSEIKNIFITGTSRGIGKELTKFFIKDGHNVYGCSRTRSTFKHKNYFHNKIDIINDKKILLWLMKLKKKNILLDVLVMNAGTMDRSFFFNQSKNKIKKLININLTSNLMLLNNVFKLLILNTNCKLVFFSSVSTILKPPGTVVYSALKIAMDTAIQILSKELKYSNFKFLIFKITYIKSKMSKTLNLKKLKELKSKVKIKNLSSTKKIYDKINKCDLKKKNRKLFIFKDELIK